jgi:tRNA(fMet)-specific endonuclease VapC
MAFYMIFMNGGREEGELDNSGYLFDTDVLIAFLRGKNARLKKQMNDLLRRDIPVYMSIISLGELYLGAFKSDNTPKNMALVNSLKERLDLLELTEDTVMLYGEIEAVLEKSGQMIGDFDVLIASTAIRNDVTLVSGNERHFNRIVTLFGQLQFESWDIN